MMSAPHMALTGWSETPASPEQATEFSSVIATGIPVRRTAIAGAKRAITPLEAAVEASASTVGYPGSPGARWQRLSG